VPVSDTLEHAKKSDIEISGAVLGGIKDIGKRNLIMKRGRI
jgi:hypothetical protein